MVRYYRNAWKPTGRCTVSTHDGVVRQQREEHARPMAGTAEQAHEKGQWKIGDGLYRKLEDEIEQASIEGKRTSHSVAEFLRKVQETAEKKGETAYSVRHLAKLMNNLDARTPHPPARNAGFK